MKKDPGGKLKCAPQREDLAQGCFPNIFDGRDHGSHRPRNGKKLPADDMTRQQPVTIDPNVVNLRGTGMLGMS